MHRIQSVHKKFVLLVLVVSIALSLCPVDHLIPMAEATTHSETALAECMPDACTTLESKRTLLQEKTVQAKRLPVPDALFISFKISFGFQLAALRFSLNGDAPPLPSLNNLYHLHATYLI